MGPKEHAEVFRMAARIVGAMDPRLAQMCAAQGGNNSGLSFGYSQTQGATWDAYRSASYVLNVIAAEYEKVSVHSATKSNP